jgi:hypothetical protein
MYFEVGKVGLWRTMTFFRVAGGEVSIWQDKVGFGRTGFFRVDCPGDCGRVQHGTWNTKVGKGGRLAQVGGKLLVNPVNGHAAGTSPVQAQHVAKPGREWVTFGAATCSVEP